MLYIYYGKLPVRARYRFKFFRALTRKCDVVLLKLKDIEPEAVIRGRSRTDFYRWIMVNYPNTFRVEYIEGRKDIHTCPLKIEYLSHFPIDIVSFIQTDELQKIVLDAGYPICELRYPSSSMCLYAVEKNWKQIKDIPPNKITFKIFKTAMRGWVKAVYALFKV